MGSSRSSQYHHLCTSGSPLVLTPSKNPGIRSLDPHSYCQCDAIPLVSNPQTPHSSDISHPGLALGRLHG
ncbi:MAG: hypothetical protein VX780_01460 [Pseudomonadota bacterium]|nr:hypothetical protein [Pseudomonadota bacterium]